MRTSIIGASISWMVAAACAPAVDGHAAQDLAVVGRVHGLWDGADGVVLRLQSDGVDVLRTVSTNGAFRFEAALAAGSPYAVTVARSPAQHDCVIEHGGSGMAADASAPSVSVACTGPAVAIALSGAWGWSFDPTQEVQTFAGPLAAQEVALTVSGAAAMQARVDGATVPRGAQTAPIALSLGSRIVPVSFQAGGGLAKTYQLVFERAAAVLAQVAYGKASNPDSGDFFGEAVSLSGDTLAVGAPREDSAARGVNGNQADNSKEAAGAVYVFVRTGTTWSQQAYLKASNPDVIDVFGESISLSGDTLAVGAREESSASASNQADNSAFGAGAVYVFQRSGTTWSQQAYLKASNIDAHDDFGISVSLSGDTLAVGASGEGSAARGINGNQNDNSALAAGAVYVFQRTGQTWAQQAYLKASNTDSLDLFGSSVALSGNTLAVGAPNESSAARGINGNQNDNSLSVAGAVYVFQRTGSTWTQQAYLKAGTPEGQASFGRSLSLSSDTLAVGTSESDGALFSGAVYVFARSAGQWTQQAFLKASNSEASDDFGGSVAISGDTLVVGATGEDSIATGINGNQNDNTARGAGAAYLFTRSGTVWTQQAYLKASNTQLAFRTQDGSLNDRFGKSVSVSGSTLVVGAYFEFGGSAGINGNQADNSKSQAGAIYIFQQ
jgi:hypothetical protein